MLYVYAFSREEKNVVPCKHTDPRGKHMKNLIWQDKFKFGFPIPIVFTHSIFKDVIMVNQGFEWQTR